jgi:hypothetical protein
MAAKNRPSTSTRNQDPMASRRRLLKAIGLGAASVALVGGGAGLVLRSPPPTAPTSAGVPPTDYSARFAAFEVAPAPNGDLSRVVWPAFVTRAGPDVKRLYEFNITNGDLMRYMPCFCGCQWEDNHRNNRDCYVEQVNPDGSVVLDPMAPT